MGGSRLEALSANILATIAALACASGVASAGQPIKHKFRYDQPERIEQTGRFKLTFWQFRCNHLNCPGNYELRVNGEVLARFDVVYVSDAATPEAPPKRYNGSDRRLQYLCFVGTVGIERVTASITVESVIDRSQPC